MALAAYALLSLAELKEHLAIAGPGQDAALSTVINDTTDEFENYLNRQFVYRPTAEAVAALVNGQSWASGAITVANQPNSIGRTLMVTWTLATGGTLTVTGTVGGVAAVTEVFDVANGLTQNGLKFFTAISGAVATNAAGAGTVTVLPSQGYVEYHTMRVNGRDLMTDELRPREWPVISIGELCEDLNWPRTYPTSSRLVQGSDYDLVKAPRHYLRRLMAGSVAVGWYWPTGMRVDGLAYGPAPRPIRLTYAAGYASAATVPGRIKSQAKRYAALLWREIDRKIQGVQSQSDALGNFTRFGAAKITQEMADALQDEDRMEFYETGEPA